MSLGDAIWAAVSFTLIVMFIGMFVTAFGELIRREDLSGWGKAAWALVLLVLPLLGVLAYVIARPKSPVRDVRLGEFPSDRERRLGR